MSILIDDCPVALVAPRVRTLLADARLHADDAQPRLLSRSEMPTADLAWRRTTGSTTRGFEAAAQQGTQDGRIAGNGVAYVTATAADKRHFSIRSGPPTLRPPA